MTASDTKPDKAPRGLTCGACGGRLRVVYTRGRLAGVVQRLRACRSCGERFLTWERRIPSGMKPE